MDIIKVLDNHDGKVRVMDEDLQEILFANNDFTLHDLSMIAKVVHDVRANYHLKGAQCYWFVATIVGVAMSLYKWTLVERSPTSSELGKIYGISFLDVFWGANVEDSVGAAIPLFKKLQAANEELIEGETNPAETVGQGQAKTKQETEQAQKQAQRLQELAEEATFEENKSKRELQEKEAETARLRGLLAQNVVPRTAEHRR